MEHKENFFIANLYKNVLDDGNSIAIKDEKLKKVLTYNELWDYSSRIVASINSVDKSDIHERKIAIEIKKSWKYLVALVAIQRLGDTVVLIDTSLPKQRISKYLDNVQPDFVISDSENDNTSVFKKIDFDEAIRCNSDNTFQICLPFKSETAFIACTSGSTGTPKSVCLSYDGMNYTLQAIINYTNLDCNVKGSWFTSAGYGMIEVDPLPILATGGTLFIPDEIISKDIFSLSNWIDKNNITHVLLMTSIAGMLWNLNIKFNNLKYMLIAGERCKNFPPSDINYEVLNIYGSAEAAVVSICNLKVDKTNNRKYKIPSIGKPIDGVSLYIVDKDGNKVKSGQEGELVVTGKTLSVGYLNDFDNTNNTFKKNILDNLSKKQYHTGDRALETENGSYIILGRMDSMIKIRGNRVDLLELESVVTCIPEVIRAACIFEDDFEQTLHLFVETNVNELKKDLIISYIKSQLPSFYIPNNIIFMPIPLNVNDKTDYTKLKSLIKQDEMRENFEKDKFRTHMEIINDMWIKWTKSDSSNLEDNFFYSGGDSLRLMRMFGELSQRYGIKLEMVEFLKNPTFENLLKMSKNSKNINVPKFKNNIRKINEFELNESQQSLWIGRGTDYKFGGVGCQGYFEWEIENLDFDRFKNAINLLIKRHEMLRAIFVSTGLQKIIENYDINDAVRYENLSNLSYEDYEMNVNKIREKFSNDEIGVSTWPLFKFLVLKNPNGKYSVHFVIDMLIADAWSIFQVIIPDIIDLYNSSECSLPLLKTTFNDYIKYKNELKKTDSYNEDKKYWKEKIKNLPPAPKFPTYDNYLNLDHKFKRFEGYVDKEAYKKLDLISKKFQVSKSCIIALALCEIFRLWGENDDFTLNFPVSDRLPISKDIDFIVGDFTNTLLVPYTISKTKTLKEKLLYIQKEIWQSLDHRLFSGVEVLRELSRLRKSGKEPLMPIVLTSLLGHPGRHDESLFGKEVYGVSQTPQVILDVQLRESDKVLYFKWDYLSNVIREDVLRDMFNSFKELLYRMATDCLIWEEKDVVSLPKKQAITRNIVNDTDFEVPDVHLKELIKNRLELTPNSISLIEQNGYSLTWKEVVYNSLKICKIISENVNESEKFIGIILNKSSLQYISIYGCVLYGVGYVPIDPSLPNDRIIKIIEKANIKTIISEEKINLKVNIKQIIIDKEKIYSQELSDSINSEFSKLKNVDPSYVPYIIFTSGSTGEPKGVEIPERALVNHIFDVVDRFNLNKNTKHLATAAIHFDMSVFDIFGPILHGGSVVIPKHSVGPDPDGWFELQKKYFVNFWACVPALMELICMVNQPKSAVIESMKNIVMAGDWIPLNIIPRIKDIYPQSKLYSCGGPTETTNWSIIHEINDREGILCESVVYGSPMRNSKYRIVSIDGWDEKPNWVVGEMIVESDITLANGYIGDKFLTEKYFSMNPITGKRSYRTGDIGRYLPNGEIEIIGRIDNQIKINGLRIELGEIENVAMQINGVRRACAFSVKDNITKLPKYISLCILSDDTNIKDKVRRQLQSKLPKYMIPKTIIVLPVFPLSKNGKIDIKELRKIEKENGSTNMSRDVLNEKKELIKIFSDILNQEIVLPEENFIDIGGDSLTAMKASVRISEKFNKEISLQDIILSNTISDVINKVIGEDNEK